MDKIQLDLIHLILIGIVFLLIFLFLYFFKKRQHSNEYKNIQSKDTSNTTKMVKLSANEIMDIEPINKDKNNQKTLSEITELLNTELIKYSGLLVDVISSAYFNHFSDLVDFMEKKGDEEFGMEDFEKVINWAKISNIKSDIENGYIEAADFIIQFYVEFVNEFVDIYKDNDLKKYNLTEDQKVLEKNKIISILKQNTNPLYIELNELQMYQSKLNNMFPKLKEIAEKNKGFNWGYFARNFAEGALAGMIPIIGIPKILYSWFGDYKKSKAQKEFLEEFDKIYTDYLNQWDKIREIYIPIYDSQIESMKNKTKSSLIDSLLKVLNVIDNKGYSLTKALTSFKKGFKDLEKEINSGGE